ncbi:MAG TPA: TIR domain-containing protein [Sphingomicrobium sp.]|nr:TIR domain-containing protein [Sphingomicrobium sp.]
MTDATDIFLSYKAEDRARLAPLVAALEAEGFSVWWDARIGGGANWRQEIERHLDAAKCVIVAWSKGSVGPEGDFVRDEATRARRLGTYLPIRIDSVEPPLGFGEVQALSLKGWNGKRSDARFQALRDAVRRRLAGEEPGSAPAVPAPARVPRRAVLAGGAVAIAAASAGGWLVLRPSDANAKRIAVLPFANLSNDPEQAYFSDGIAEELRAALSRIGMEVMGRASSVAVKDLDTRTAAARLKVAHILTGSVRRSPQLIRITAQLVSGEDGVERWAQSYDRAPGDAIKIQADIAHNVARSLSVALAQAARTALALGGTSDSLAQDLVLRGREQWVSADSAEKLQKALDLTDAAIARDPHYADAHVQRSMIFMTLAENDPTDGAAVARQLASAESAARRAAEIAPRLGSPHVALARLATNRIDIAGTLSHTERALELSPDDPQVLLDAATTFATLGRGEEGLRLADRLIALDGLNARAFARKSLILLQLRRYREAIEAVAMADRIAPGNPARAAVAGDAWLLLGRPDKALAEYAKMPPDDYLRMTGEAIAAARAGDPRKAEQIMAEMKRLFGASTSYQYAMIHAQLGDRNRAFAEFDNALAAKDPGLMGLKTDVFLDPIRNDPRYSALLRKLRFP